MEKKKEYTTEIVPGSKDDIQTIVQFQVDMAMESEGARLEREKVLRGVSAVMEDASKGEYFVAKAEGKIVGSLLITKEWSDWNNGWYWWVQSVFVVPEHRKQGTFKSMYAALRKRAQEQGIAEIRLYVDNNNLTAQKAYQHVGMKTSHYQMYEERLCP